jgi:hypothetical protein
MKPNSLKLKAPHLEAEWHPTKNGDVKFEGVTCGSERGCWWVCSKMHEWSATPYNRTSNASGCPTCSTQRNSGPRKARRHNSLAFCCPELRPEWHPKNERSFDSVTKGCVSQFWWICPRGHEWEAPPNDRTSNKGGCPYCSGRRVSPQNALSAVRPQLCQEWHPTKNGQLTPDTVSYGSAKKVWWVCSKGHEWPASIANRAKALNPRGCPQCADIAQHSKAELAILEAVRQCHPDACHGDGLLSNKRFKLDIYMYRRFARP